MPYGKIGRHCMMRSGIADGYLDIRVKRPEAGQAGSQKMRHDGGQAGKADGHAVTAAADPLCAGGDLPQA
ncbi:hypothetical protein D3C86_1715690 [compost metagenome]